MNDNIRNGGLTLAEKVADGRGRGRCQRKRTIAEDVGTMTEGGDDDRIGGHCQCRGRDDDGRVR